MERVWGKGGVSSQRGATETTGGGEGAGGFKKKKISTTPIYFHYLWQIEWTP